jgi:dUTP pyrophosphatase
MNYTTNNIPYLLELFVDPTNTELFQTYQEAVDKHNKFIVQEEYYNSGFDLFCPSDTIFYEQFETKFIDHNVRAKMTKYIKHYSYESLDNGLDCSDNPTPSGFYLYPRSSLSKIPLMLANHVGIIDSSYRGPLIGAFRYLKANPDGAGYRVDAKTRLMQICSPDLSPFIVRLVNSIKDLGETDRGEKGFGSTGK